MLLARFWCDAWLGSRRGIGSRASNGVRAIVVTSSGDRAVSLRSLLDSAAAACDRGDWAAALAIAQAAAALDAEDPAVVDMLARADRGAPAGARRRMTVVFCDLVRSTELASGLDPEETRELLNAYYDVCTEAVRRHDGHVGRLVGDGVLICFGYPRAHEDAGLRAVLTAVAIRDAVRRLRPWDLEVRIGIHTGLAVVSDLGSGPWTSAGEIVGEAPHLAARVQAVAPPGGVVMTADALALVRDRAQHRALGPHALKGINRPVELHELLSVRPGPATGTTGTHARTIGRDEERAALARAWDDARERFRYAVIAGEAGIGKTHLVRCTHDLVTDAERVVVLRCSALHTNTPLHPIAGATTEHADDPLDRLARICDELGGDREETLYLLALATSTPWPDDRAVPDLQPEQARERAFALLCDWLDRQAAGRRALIVVEDLHWADPSTLDLLTRYVTGERRHPALVVATTRRAPDTAPGAPTAGPPGRGPGRTRGGRSARRGRARVRARAAGAGARSLARRRRARARPARERGAPDADHARL
jgi:class 3 adenylate cyclase